MRSLNPVEASFFSERMCFLGSITLGLQGPSKKVFGVGLEGPNTFWGGTWSPRVRELIQDVCPFDEPTAQHGTAKDMVSGSNCMLGTTLPGTNMAVESHRFVVENGLPRGQSPLPC